MTQSDTHSQETPPGGNPADPSTTRRLLTLGGRKVFLVVMLVAAVVYTVLALRYPLGELVDPGLGFLPTIVGVALCVATLKALLSNSQGSSELDEDEPGGSDDYESSPLYVGAFVAALVVYVLLLGTFGQMIASIAVVLASLILYRARPWWQMVIFAVGMTAASYVVFDLLLGVPLPKGAGL